MDYLKVCFFFQGTEFLKYQLSEAQYMEEYMDNSLNSCISVLEA